VTNIQLFSTHAQRRLLVLPIILILILTLVGTAFADFNYTVKSGDTLSKIAQNNNTTVAALISANKAKFPCLATNAACLQAGWVIIIPGTGGTTITQGPSTYTVQSGDSLFKIARKFGVTYTALITANKTAHSCLATPTPCPLQIGWTLIIPGGGTVAAVTATSAQTPESVITEYFAALNARDAARFKATLHPNLLANEPDPDFDIQNFISILSDSQIQYQILSTKVVSQSATSAEVSFAIRIASPFANINGYEHSATFSLAKSGSQWRILDENIELVELIP